ncbi:hypothetical protein Csa_010440 [Cucumis sativus]|uniref:Uncharacterized protein n=1 Tax=Cucumis sativus TaxID=3659 RepID=A0A0A0L719_CUCSA|nr:hypothetical protein Csa_010440 [Cucumis sativus]
MFLKVESPYLTSFHPTRIPSLLSSLVPCLSRSRKSFLSLEGYPVVIASLDRRPMMFPDFTLAVMAISLFFIQSSPLYA